MTLSCIFKASKVASFPLSLSLSFLLLSVSLYICVQSQEDSLLLRTYQIGYTWIVQNSHPISRCVTSILSAKYLLLCQVTYPQGLGIVVWTSLWAMILPITKHLLEIYWTLCLLIFPFYILHFCWHVCHSILIYDYFTTVLGGRKGKWMSLIWHLESEVFPQDCVMSIII